MCLTLQNFHFVSTSTGSRATKEYLKLEKPKVIVKTAGSKIIKLSNEIEISYFLANIFILLFFKYFNEGSDNKEFAKNSQFS